MIVNLCSLTADFAKSVKREIPEGEILPLDCRCENEGFVGWCFVGLVVSAESVFCGGGEF